ncbi:MAG: alkaline phosphatase family protein [Planctomycetia bacterium]|nr:MAG: alkaline phosphatase family protein [Planctomycetia bacterium]
MTQPPAKILTIGLDGATFDLMLPWIDEGRLPHLGRLLGEGAWSPLASTIPPITPCAWSSFMTGKNPGKHGLFDFVEPVPGQHTFRFTNASARKAESLWKILGRHDRRVGVVNVPMTYPPESVNGYMLSGLDTPHEKSVYSFPAELRAELEAGGISYRVDLRHLGDMCTDRRRDRRLMDMREMESIRTDAVRYLRRTCPVDFNMVVYIAIDQVQHHFWHYMDPEHDKFDAAGAAKYGTAIRDMYAHIDGQVGRLLDNVDDETMVIVMSDHGFGPTRNTRLRLNQALAHKRLLAFVAEGGSQRRWRVVAGLVDHCLRSNLGPGMKARLAAMFPRLRQWLEVADEAPIDWSRTLAFANEVYRASPAIWLNRRDRVPDGVIDSDEKLHAALAEVEAALGRLKDPQTGAPVMQQVYRTRDLYHGPYVANAPDLLPSWWLDGFLLEQSRPDGGWDAAVEHSTAPVSGGKEFSGSHRLDGVFIVHGGPARAGHAFTGARIIDVAPTTLYLMGLAIPDDMDGEILRDAIDPDYVSAHPPRYEPAGQGGEPPSGETPSMSAEEEQLLARRLQALGYIE